MKERTIEPCDPVAPGMRFAVYEHDEYPESSILAGNVRRTAIDFADTAEELKEQYPDAEVLDHSTRCDPVLPSAPPDWFDPADAGEEW